MRTGLNIDIRINIKKVIILAVIFVVALVIFSLREQNTGTVEDAGSMAEATFPVLYFQYDGSNINECHGYANEMDITTMRDCVTPVGDSLELSFELDKYGAGIKGISYSVRTTVDDRLLEEEEIEDITDGGDTVTGTISLGNLMDEDEEYVLTLAVTTEDLGVIYYYTNIRLEGDAAVSEALDFVKNFNEVTLSGSNGSKIATYVEPDSTNENDDLSYVDITSSLTQIMWADFGPTLETEVTVDISDITDTYQSFVLRYSVTGTSDEAQGHVYEVEEYYRVRVGEERTYLIEYERTTNQQFDETAEVYADSSICLGVRDSDVDYVSNDTGTLAAFVQEGELYLYNQQTNTVVDVFGFLDDNDTDIRDLYGEHDIKICSMDESGSIEFVVYGYMNRGDYEGYTGVGVYRYDRSENTVQEEVFIPSDKSYQVLAAQMDELFYVNSENDFFLVFDGTLYSINMTTQSTEAVVKDLEEGAYAFSEESGCFAYVKDVNASDTMYIINLNTDVTTEVSATSGHYIRPLAYLDEDLVYGEADCDDIIYDVVGHVTFPMSTLTILDSDLSVMKSYDEGKKYVVSVYTEENTLHMERITISDGVVKEASEDTIINYEDASATDAKINPTYTDDIIQTQVYLTFTEELDDDSPRVVEGDIAVTDNPQQVDVLQSTIDGLYYYVYRSLEIVESGMVASGRISLADETGGVVVSSRGRIIWNRDRLDEIELSGVKVPDSASDASTIAKCIDAILEYEEISNNSESYLEDGLSVYETMSTVLEDRTVLDLCGCTVEEVLNYVSAGTPVLAFTDDDEAVLIVGYDEYNTILFYPESGESDYYGLEDSETLFSGAGSIYYGYTD
ncbi:MAG: hypothetical protein K5840_03555 [Eubacterium sp.]|nr:hypothetical protein [Eubacterium sp.]